MSTQPNRALRLLLVILCAGVALTLAGSLFPLRPHAETKATPAHFNHDVNDEKHSQRPGKDWDEEKSARESWSLHEANRQRLALVGQPDALQASALESLSSDVNDISIIQDDGSLIIPRNPFDLTGRVVQFTPSGNGYVTTSGAAAFDSNLGGKLDLTKAPAVNPKTASDAQVEAGDDAYILQDLGFGFNFYGASYAQAAVSSNGTITFRPAGTTDAAFDSGAVDSGESLAVLQSGLPRIAAYWHDLDARAAKTQGANGIYLRRDTDRVVITWNNVGDFPNSPSVDKGVHRFQVTLFSDGRITLYYDSVTLTSSALVGISPGGNAANFTVMNFAAPAQAALATPLAEYFSISDNLDEIGALKAFYAAHPGQDKYDFAYLFLDFDFSLGNAFAFYAPLRNDVRGLGQQVFDSDPGGDLGGKRLMGYLQMNNIEHSYPEYPTQRFLGANSMLSVMGQEQGHRWMSFPKYPGADAKLLLGRDDAHWNFYLNIESTTSLPAARRSSSMEGNVWQDNGNGTFTSVNLIDGYSRLDQYLMGLRPASDVPDTFIIANPTSSSNVTRATGPKPNVTVTGARQAVTMSQIAQQNGARTPDVATSQKSFRAAVILLTTRGATPSAATINKLTRFRLAWESYFALSTDYLATINTGLADAPTSRVMATVSAASYQPLLTPGGIGSIFGQGLTNGGTAAASSLPLPTTLAGATVLVNGVPAPLFYASPLQLNFQLPPQTEASAGGVQSSTATVEVLVNNQLVRAGAVQVAPAQPYLFTLNQQGTGAAAALDAVTFAGAPFNALRAGGQPNIISLYGTGFGSDMTDADGDFAGNVQVTFNGSPAAVQYAGRAPGFAGLNQINFVLPAGVGAGTYPVVATRNGLASNAVTVTVR